MSTQNSNTISLSGDYKMHYVRLHKLSSQINIDITNMVNYVEVFESMFSPFLTVNVNILDNIGLLEKTPLIGEEFVELDIRGPDNELGLISAFFYIFKLTDRKEVSDRGVVYTLSCISPTAIKDMNLKISKAYTGQPSDLVKSPLKEEALEVEKDIYCEDTKDKVQYISNYWSPLENIKYLSLS